MLESDLTKVYISEYEDIKEHGESKKVWKYKDHAFLNLQQDINELDRKPTGEVDYDIQNARTDMEYDIQKGNGVSIIDISKLAKGTFVPNYTVTDNPKIGTTTLYKLAKYNGEIEEDEY